MKAPNVQGLAIKAGIVLGGVALAYIVYRVATGSAKETGKDVAGGVVGAVFGVAEGLIGGVLGGVRDVVGNPIAEHVTAPALDWAYSADNPLSDEAAENKHQELVNQRLQQLGKPGLSNSEWWIARGYAPSVGLYGTAAKYVNSFFFTANPLVCADEAAREIIRRRG